MKDKILTQFQSDLLKADDWASGHVLIHGLTKAALRQIVASPDKSQHISSVLVLIHTALVDTLFNDMRRDPNTSPSWYGFRKRVLDTIEEFKDTKPED